MTLSIPTSVTAGRFATSSTDAHGNPVDDTYTWSSDADPSLATVSLDGTITLTGALGYFRVTATNPAGATAYIDCVVVPGPATVIGEPTFTPAG